MFKALRKFNFFFFNFFSFTFTLYLFLFFSINSMKRATYCQYVVVCLIQCWIEIVNRIFRSCIALKIYWSLLLLLIWKLLKRPKNCNHIFPISIKHTIIKEWFLTLSDPQNLFSMWMHFSLRASSALTRMRNNFIKSKKSDKKI